MPAPDTESARSELRGWVRLCLAAPLVVLSGAFSWLAVEHGTFGLWNVTVHESGRYTLGETVLYFSHFLREIPTAIAMALFLVSAYGPPAPADRRRDAARRALMWLGFLGAGILAVLAFASSAHQAGAGEAALNLGQLYTRDDLPAYGSHWRFHFLSTLWFGVAAPVLAWCGFTYFGGPRPGSTRGTSLAWAAWLYFIGCTMIFAIGLEPFVDPRFLGHQAREIATHSIVTLPLGLGLLACVHQILGIERRASLARTVSTRALAAILIPAYLGIATVARDAMSSAQDEHGLAAMVAAHFFEHSLDYVFVGLLAIGLQAARRPAARWLSNP